MGNQCECMNTSNERGGRHSKTNVLPVPHKKKERTITQIEAMMRVSREAEEEALKKKEDQDGKRESIRSNKSNKRPSIIKPEAGESSVAIRATNKLSEELTSAAVQLEGEHEHFRDTEKVQYLYNGKIIKEESKVQAIPERRTESISSSKHDVNEQQIDFQDLKESSTLVEQQRHLTPEYTHEKQDFSIKQASSCTVQGMKVGSPKSGIDLPRQSETDAHTLQQYNNEQEDEEEKDQVDMLVDKIDSRASGTEAYESRETMQNFLDQTVSAGGAMNTGSSQNDELLSRMSQVLNQVQMGQFEDIFRNMSSIHKQRLLVNPSIASEAIRSSILRESRVNTDEGALLDKEAVQALLEALINPEQIRETIPSSEREGHINLGGALQQVPDEIDQSQSIEISRMTGNSNVTRVILGDSMAFEQNRHDESSLMIKRIEDESYRQSAASVQNASHLENAALNSHEKPVDNISRVKMTEESSSQLFRGTNEEGTDQTDSRLSTMFGQTFRKELEEEDHRANPSPNELQ
ncbi:hypothetical protein FGO68_gene9096 [Halteria grandinella]|uniref:Uncharacterized protein n=1 Tax=Halteria grandinella TaxID=5974 RepID=A0A8J8NT49_HALGN|nr:hypothetical protein FGO68_gene9096 [Halteria grandinella]